jgi:GNAT superfamily N-acetyltransferase
MEWLRDDGHLVSDDQTRIDLAQTHQWLSNQYWALGRSHEIVSKAIENSVALALVNPEGEQVGFARWATDRAVIAMLCDVFVAPEYRGRGLGKFIVASAVAHPDVAGSSCAFWSPATPTASTSSPGSKRWPVPNYGWNCVIRFDV